METQNEILTPDQLEHKAYASSLRLIADWFESHPEIPLPSNTFDLATTTNKEEFGRVAKAMGSFKKDYAGEMIYLKKEFGTITLSCVEYRNKVCERRVVGKEIVKQQKPTAFEEVEVEKEIVEWHCTEASLLK